MRITELWTYPIKGCRGTRLHEAVLTATGIANDRSWMIVDRTGMFVTQRGDPKLARISASYSGQDLVLSADGDSIVVPSLRGAQLSVRVWRSTGIADDAGDEVAQWLTRFVGMECRLVRTGAAWQREVVVDGSPRPLSFADGFPFLMVSEASLADLNGRLPAPVPMNRFRPNIVVDGIDAYTEDLLGTATCGEIVLRGVRPCVRCAVTTTDQQTGARDRSSEPLRTLARYRNNRELKGAIFGMNIALDKGAGATLRVGDQLEVKAREIDPSLLTPLEKL